MKMTFEKMTPTQEIERLIIRKLVEDALREGYTVKHNDGESDTVTVSTDGIRKSDEAISALADEVMKWIQQTDEEHLIFSIGGSRVGSVFLVYGNDGYDVIADHTDTDEMRHLLIGAEALAESIYDER